MKTLNTTELIAVLDAMEDNDMIGDTKAYVSDATTDAHAHVLTSHTEEEGYTHFLTMHTMTREVLAHELAHMHLHVVGRYNQDDQHGDEHTGTTDAMMKLINHILQGE